MYRDDNGHFSGSYLARPCRQTGSAEGGVMDTQKTLAAIADLAVHNIAVTKRLTLVMTKDVSMLQADADVEVLADPATPQIVRTDVGENYFNQLRLRVEQDPALASQIEVLYIADGKTHRVGLSFEDELRWPPGFLQAAWVIEEKIILARKLARGLAQKPSELERLRVRVDLNRKEALDALRKAAIYRNQFEQAKQYIAVLKTERDQLGEELTLQRQANRVNHDEQKQEVEHLKRWEIGFRNIVTAVLGPRVQFEIPDVVERVKTALGRIAELEAALKDERERNKTLTEHIGTLISLGESIEALDEFDAARRPA